MALEYERRETFWHNLDPRTKLIWGFLIILQLAIWTDPLWQLVTLVIILIPGIIAKTPWRKVLKFLKPLLPVMLLLLLAEAILYPAERLNIPQATRPLFTIGGVKATLGGFLFGLNLVEKILFTIIFTSILTYTVPFTDVLYIMQRLGLPYQVAFIMSTAWRLIPYFRTIYNEVVCAQKARGLELEKYGLIGRIKHSIAVLVPLYSTALDMTERMALAMESRAFGASKKPTILREFKFSRKDYVILVICIILMALSLAITVIGYGRL